MSDAGLNMTYKSSTEKKFRRTAISSALKYADTLVVPAAAPEAPKMDTSPVSEAPKMDTTPLPMPIHKHEAQTMAKHEDETEIYVLIKSKDGSTYEYKFCEK
jgi:hypothetical protein